MMPFTETGHAHPPAMEESVYRLSDEAATGRLSFTNQLGPASAAAATTAGHSVGLMAINGMCFP